MSAIVATTNTVNTGSENTMVCVNTTNGEIITPIPASAPAPKLAIAATSSVANPTVIPRLIARTILAAWSGDAPSQITLPSAMLNPGG